MEEQRSLGQGKFAGGFTSGLSSGLTSFDIKLVALVLMTLDHIAVFFAEAAPIPAWFRMLGRMSAPLFIFAMAQGFGHTSSKRKYLERLLLAAVLMNGCNFLINRSGWLAGDIILTNAIFATMFFIGYFCWALENAAAAFRCGTGITAAIAALSLPLLLDLCTLGLAGSDGLAGALTVGILPSPLTSEGHYVFIFMGVCFYFLRDRKILLSVFYILLSLWLFWAMTLPLGLDYQTVFIERNQWMMVFALGFMWLYNGRRGRRMKYFFYFYYPLHIYLFVFLGQALR